MQSRIGLSSGPAIVGNMGSRSRFNYTMTGDNVNLAARMESGAKSWGVYTMCTEATKAACEQHAHDRIVFRPLGRIVGGEELETFEDRARYHACDFPGAIAGFRRSLPLEPNQPGQTPGVKNNPSLVYLDICTRSLTEPPPADWDGAYVMTEK